MNQPILSDDALLPLPARRRFLRRAGLGAGSLALATLLHQEGLLTPAARAAGVAAAAPSPLAPRPSHFPGRARAVIWLFMTGSPSQVDTFDYKPELQKRHGEK